MQELCFILEEFDEDVDMDELRFKEDSSSSLKIETKN
jgi:hypothetical protein